MPLELETFIALPEHVGKRGFDHADVHAASDRLYVAHTSNNALDVIDCGRNAYVEPIPDLKAVAGRSFAGALGGRVPSRDTSRSGVSGSLIGCGLPLGACNG
jgi:hypothetical protein